MGGMEIKRSSKHKKKKTKKDKKRDRSERDEAENESEHTKTTKVTRKEAPPIVICNGSGRISTSGTTVHGYEGTKFMTELRVGDAVIVTHPTSLVDETRIVKMVLSNISMGLSSAFSSDLISTTSFRYVKAPDEVVDTEGAERSKREKATVTEDEAFGTYAGKGGTKFTYRVMRGNKTGYDIVTEEVQGKTRGDLLDMRSKKKADRFCM